MKHLSFIPKSDQKTLQDAIYRIRRQPYGDFYGEEIPISEAPEVLLVKVPETGIPPMEVTAPDDGSYTAKYTLGKAECEVMFIEKDFSGFGAGSDVSDLLDVDAFVKPIKSPVRDQNNSFPALLEYIYNPYPWTAYGESLPLTVGDTSVYPSLFTLAVRDRSGFFVCARPPDIIKCKPVTDIFPGGSGPVRVFLRGLDSGVTETAYLNWAHGSQKTSGGKECTIKFFEDERKWVFLTAECET